MDANLYDEASLIELKIPVHLAYQSSWSSYERYDGEVTVNGILYKYVKRKVNNDTLYLKCLPDVNKMALETARNDFFMHSNDLSKNDNSKKTDHSKSSLFKNLVNELYCSSFTVNSNTQAGLVSNHPLSFKTNRLLSTPHLSPEQPPDNRRA